MKIYWKLLIVVFALSLITCADQTSSLRHAEEYYVVTGRLYENETYALPELMFSIAVMDKVRDILEPEILKMNKRVGSNGRIYANRYQKNGVAIINPENGAIEAVIDFSPLRKKVKRHPELDVLNGIAFNKQTNTIFVTGKNWNKLFEVKVIEDR